MKGGHEMDKIVNDEEVKRVQGLQESSPREAGSLGVFTHTSFHSFIHKIVPQVHCVATLLLLL